MKRILKPPPYTKQLLGNMLLLNQAACCPVYVEELRNISTSNVVGNMLPKNKTFFIHEQHVSKQNMLLEALQHTLGPYVSPNVA